MGCGPNPNPGAFASLVGSTAYIVIFLEGEERKPVFRTVGEGK